MTSGSATGATRRADAGPRCQAFIGVGSMRTLCRPRRVSAAAPQSAAFFSAAEPPGRGPMSLHSYCTSAAGLAVGQAGGAQLLCMRQVFGAEGHRCLCLCLRAP